MNTSSFLFFDFTIRERFELWDGMNIKNYGNLGENLEGNLNDRILFQRVIAGIKYEINDKITISLHMQDSRAFGWSLKNSNYPNAFKIKIPDSNNIFYKMNPGEEFFEIYDAFVDYNDKSLGLLIKAGRQKISFGDFHICGPGEWGNTGRWTWDAVKSNLSFQGHSIAVFFGGTKIHDPEQIAIPFLNTEFWGGGTYNSLNLFDEAIFEPFWIFKTPGSTNYMRHKNFFRNWIGFRFYNKNHSGLIVDFTIAREFGKEEEKQIDALGWFGKLGWKFSEIWSKPAITIRETYATGGSKDDKKITKYEPAFGASDKYYGWMNIFQWSNLDNRELNLELYPLENMFIEIKYNWFFIPYPQEFVALKSLKLLNGKNHIGDEFNIFFSWKFDNNWQFNSLFGFFMPKDVENINNKHPENAFVFSIQSQFSL